MVPFRSRIAAAAAAGSLALLLAVPVQAQQTGRVQGSVVEAQNQQPLSGAQVYIPGTGLGTLTNVQGNYLLLNVPAGTHTLRVELIGYASQSRQITVTAGGVATANFELGASAIALDEVVVTGQGREMRRREIGNTITSVGTENLETAPISSMSEMLQGRAPGVNVLGGGGKAGQGTKVVLRGAASFSQGVEPVIYVDGVRMDNSQAFGVWTGGTAWTGLDDINPADVERIEIVKGAAAATLYGTEASNGVIQIFTKRGREGERGTWTYRGEYGASNVPSSYYGNVSVYGDWFHENYVNNAPLMEHQLSVNGGLEGFTYYASGTYRGTEGTVPNNDEEYMAGRVNLQLFPRDNLVVRLNTGYSNREVGFPQDANNIYGYGINALTAGPPGLFMPVDQIERIEVAGKSGRFTSGLTAEYSPFDNFSNRFTGGVDIVQYDNTEFQPYGANSFNPLGRKENYRRDATTLSFEYSGSFTYNFADFISSSLTGGLQAYQRILGAVDAYGRDFPAPGLSVVGSAATTFGWEWRLTTKSAGFFLQEQLGFWDRMFLTVGARADGHSAFGEDYPYQVYPKASLSYVLSEHDFVPRFFDNLRLRAAYGTAGQQPGAFDAVMTWNSVSALEGVPAVTPANLGNPELAPEVSNEFEAGIDLSVLNGRFGLEATYFDQTTTGALLPVRPPPSLGFQSTQLENVGEIANSGIELALTARLVETEDLSWGAQFNYTRTENEVTDLGGLPELYVHWTQATRLGFPVGAFFGDVYVNGDACPPAPSDLPAGADWSTACAVHSDGVLEYFDEPSLGVHNLGYIGPPFPTNTFQLSTDLTFKNRFHLRALVDHAGGQYVESATVRWMTRLSVPSGDEIVPDLAGGSTAAFCHEGSELYDDPAIQAFCDNPWPYGGRGNVVIPATYTKLRELTLSYDIPAEMMGNFGFRNGTVYLTGRNLWRDQDVRLLESEANYATGRDLSAQEYFISPIPRQFVFGLRLGF